MADLFDFGFDDPAPTELPPPAPPPAPPLPEAPLPCDGPARPGGYVCRVGKGDAFMSDNGGLSWFCRTHRPPGFFPHERQEASRGR